MILSFYRQSNTEGRKLGIELTYLAPLWKLYKNLSEEDGPEKTHAAVRALTELFLVAEDVAMVGSCNS